MYKRQLNPSVEARLQQPRRFIQVLLGPRQVGKSTFIKQIRSELSFPSHYATADEPTLKDRAWLQQQWEAARFLTRRDHGRALLVIDEAQKLIGWSETVKRLWDEDTAAGIDLHVVMLGSSPLLMQVGLTESLAGRFETINVPHWSFAEMKSAFGFSLDQYIYFGGYPGAAELIDDEQRWRSYIKDSLIETTIARDILLMQRVEKPVLLRRLFELGCAYSGQILSFQKMVGQLQDVGNTTTVAHYLDLLTRAGALAGLSKFSGDLVRKRRSSPKLQVFNTSLMTVFLNQQLASTRENKELWGRLTESAVGAHLLNGARCIGAEVHYWRANNREVDFVLARDQTYCAIEVKSGRARSALRGMQAFSEIYKPKRQILVGGTGIQLADFLETDIEHWLE